MENRWLNESLYELHRPKGAATVQVLLFHGFQPEYENPHLTTWTSRDGSHLWPQTWLAEEFPDAHILSVAYFGGKLQDVLKKYGNRVDVDMHIVIENLISDLLQAGIGQKPRCPVVLVGHSFGGLVVKQLCVRAFNQLDPDSRTAKDLETVQLVSFVDNIKGVFFYATPHHGVESRSITLLDPALLIPTGPLLDYVKLLSNCTARLNDDFERRCKQRKEWRIRGLGESLPTRFATKWRSFDALIVPEGSARYSDFNLAEGVDHFSIGQPDSKICRSFTAVKDLLEDIANDPQLVAPDGHQETGLPHYLMASEKHVLAIKQRLTEAGVLGITGMGGIGKTTVAKKVYNNISKDFEYTCFAENVKVQYNRGNNFDDWLFSKFYRNGRRAETRQWSEVKGKKTLIIMDDIDSEGQLRRLPRLEEFANGSQIILTSRDEESFRFYTNCGLYKMDFLEKDEAKQLFCLHAFGVKDVPVESNHLSKNVDAVVRKCDRLPLTLEVMGQYLRDEGDSEVWKDAVDQLTTAQSVSGEANARVWASLRVSYDALEEKQKLMFTEAGTYFFGQSLDQALGAWSMTVKNPKIMWRNLVRRSLVKEGENKTVWVHEQLRDLSRSIAKNDILFISDKKAGTPQQELLSGKVYAKTEALTVSYRRRALPLDSLAELTELKYVDLSTVEHKGSGSSFPRSVYLLKWSTKSESQFPVDLTKMKNLAVLVLRDWYVPKSFPETVGHLTNLRYLSLLNLKGLDDFPENFGDLSHLKLLHVRGIRGKTSIRMSPELFGKLLALEHLQLENVEVAELPESFGSLTALEYLTLYRVELVKLPESFGNLSSLKSLHIVDCPLKRLPDSFSRLSRVQRLSLIYLGLTELGDSFGRLSSLEDLSLMGLGITRLPDSFSQLSRLESLYISDCRSLKDLGNTFENLSSLVSFTVFNCGIDRLPESLGDLNRLETLRISAEGLQSLPSSFGKLSSLRTFFTDCPVEELPDDLGQLSCLQEMVIHSKYLKELPDGLQMLSSLKSLTIVGERLDSLPYSLGKLSSLKSLTIVGKRLESLPDNLGMLSSLENLDIKGNKLESLPESIGQLHSLRKLNLEVASIRCLPVSVQQLSSLRELRFNCKGHQRLPDNFDILPFSSLALELMGDRFGDRNGDTRPPEDLCRLSSLEGLAINGFRDIENLPEELGNLKSLRKLTIWSCDKLESLPDSLCRLSSLRELHLKYCDSLKSLPDSLGQLSSLRELYLQKCDNLKSLPHSLGRHSSSEVAPRQVERRNAEELSLQTTFGEANKGELVIFVGSIYSFVPSSCQYLDESTMRSLGWVVDGVVDGEAGTTWMSYRTKWAHNRNVPGVRILAVMVNVVVCYFLVRKVHSSLRSK